MLFMIHVSETSSSIRYGQKKTAQVYRLVSLGTIDETILQERTGRSVKDMLAAQLAIDPTSTSFPRCTKPVDLAGARTKVAKAKASAPVKAEPASEAEESEDEAEAERNSYTDSSDSAQESDEEDDAVRVFPALLRWR